MPLRPPHLQRGATIGIVSPSAPVAARQPRRWQRGLRSLKALGFEVKVGQHALSDTGHTAGRAEDRAADITSLFLDDEVDTILATIGGYNSNQLLEHLDFDAIRTHPKILMGYSDTSALLLAILEMTGLVTFMGPALLPQFAEPAGLHPFTAKALQALLLEPTRQQTLEPSGTWIRERQRWGVNDDRPRGEVPNPGPRVVREGRASGRLVAGNLGTMLVLAGSPYFPNLDGAVLCIEEDELETPASVDRYLTQLRTMGAFEQIAALLVGRFSPDVGFTDSHHLASLLLEATHGYAFPIATGFDFGHTDPMLTLPIGVRTEIDLTGQPRWTLLEPAVT